MNNSTITKTCKKCGIEKPLTNDFFVKHKRCKDGFENRCKECRSEYHKKYLKDNKEREQLRHKKYYEENKEYFKRCHNRWRNENIDRVKQMNKLYQEKNKDKIRKRRRNYREENKEYLSEYFRNYHEKNKEQLNQYKKKYYHSNKTRFYVNAQKRKAIKESLPNNFTLEQWKQSKEYFNYKCAYCGESPDIFHQEHFIPLSKGGEYTRNNILPSCARCNKSKFISDFFDWYPAQEYYSKEREQRILKYLNYNKNKVQQLALL